MSISRNTHVALSNLRVKSPMQKTSLPETSAATPADCRVVSGDVINDDGIRDASGGDVTSAWTGSDFDVTSGLGLGSTWKGIDQGGRN